MDHPVVPAKVLTVVDGKSVYGVGEYASLTLPLPFVLAE